MDPITQQQALAAAGAAGGDSLYVEDVFSTYVYKGTGNTQTITNGVDLTEGGLIWTKWRGGGSYSSESPAVLDTERGFTKLLRSDSDATESNVSAYFTAASDGYQINTSSSLVNHSSGGDYASWTFRKAPGFCDVVTYSGDGTNRAIAHSLGSKPGWFIVKSRTENPSNWGVYHRSLGATKYMTLDTSNAAGTSQNLWNNTEPTATHFTVHADQNKSGHTYVAYLFAHDDQSFGENGDESIIKCGGYTGTGSHRSIDVGFEPQWVLIKVASGDTGNWYQYDLTRGWRFDPDDNQNQLIVNNGNPEFDVSPSGGLRISRTSTGFDLYFSDHNKNQKEYIYIAIRRPHKPPTVGTDVFAVDNQTTGTKPPQYHSNFPVDWAWTIAFGESQAYRDREAFTRLLGRNRLKLNESATEASYSSAGMDYMDGWHDNNSSVSTTYSWMFKRAPKFFDVVAYEGNGNSGRTIDHNLGVVPEFWIFKRRNSTGSWTAGSSYLSNPTGDRLILNSSGGSAATGITAWTNTATTFLADYSGIYNTSGGDYVAYFFASCPGVSKIGTYTGDGGNNNYVYLGSSYTTQPRFILAKATSTTGDWVLLDSLRGNAGGYDPYAQLNTDNAEITGTNVVHAFAAGSGNSAGFIPNGILNTSGVTYLYLAIL